MGGLGSGRHWYYSAKSTVHNYHSIDIRKWRREGLLIPNTSFSSKWYQNIETIGSISVLVAENHIKLSYRYKHSEKWEEMSYLVYIEWSSCNFGGERPWFHCPACNCGRRVTILYGGRVFACRHCYQLVYPSQRENIGERAARKADKIRNYLEWEPGILNGEGLKPKGMHLKTYRQLCLSHNELVNLSLREARLRFGINMYDL